MRLIVGNKCLGMLEAAGEVFPGVKYRRRSRNVFSAVPRTKMKTVAQMLKDPDNLLDHPSAAG